MARGHPDYIKSVGYTQEGLFLQEYSIPPLWLHDDFEFTTNKWEAPAGTVTIETTVNIGGSIYYPFNGDGMLFIVSVVGGLGSASRTIGTFPQTCNCGFSCMFLYHLIAHYKNQADSLVPIYCDYWTGTRNRRFAIGYNPQTSEWAYLDNTGAAWVVFATLPITQTGWHYCKLIVDPITSTYENFQIDNNVYSLVGIGYLDAASVLAVEFDVFIYIRASAASTARLLVDDYKITYGET